MKRFLALLITFAMLLSAVPAFANETTVTVTSTFNNAAGVPVNATIPLTFSEEISSLDASAISVTPSINGSATVDGNGTDWTVKFGTDMAYETEYTLTVGTYGTIKFTTQFDTTSSKYYSFGTYTKGATQDLPVKTKEFTAEIDVDKLYSDVPDVNSGSASLKIMDSTRNLSITCGFTYNADRSGSISFSYGKPGNSAVNINHLFVPNNLGPNDRLQLTEARKYALTLKNNTLYVFNIGDNNKTMLGYIVLDFYEANFAQKGFTADKWQVDSTSYVAFKFAVSELFSATSTFNNMKGVPVNAQIPLTYTKDVSLSKDDVTISPAADFAVEGSGKEYAVKFTNGMDYETDYVISVKNIEIVKYRTEYDCTDSQTIKGNGTSYKATFDNTSKNFSAEMDITEWTNNTNASRATLNFNGNEGYSYNISLYEISSDRTTFKANPTVRHPDIPASQYAAAGVITSDKPVTVSMNYKKLIMTVEDYKIYLYGVNDNSVDYLTSWNMRSWRNWTPISGDIVPTTVYWTDTSLVSAKFGAPVSAKFTSSLNGKTDVPVNALIPLTCNKNIVLNKDDISVSPASDFTVEGSGKNYAVKFKDDMKNNTKYTVSFGDVEVAKYSTAYGPLTSITYSYEKAETLPKKSADFIATLDFSEVIANNGQSSNVRFTDIAKNIWFEFQFNYPNDDNDKFAITIRGADSNGHTAGPAGIFNVKRSEIHTLVVTHKNYMLNIYALDKDGNVLNHGTQTTEFVNFSCKTLGYQADSIYLSNTSKIKVKYAAISAVEITSCTESNGEINADVDINTSLDNNAVLIFAAYNDSNKILVDADVKSVSDAVSGKVSFKVNGIASSYKLFVLDSIDNLTPVYDAVSGTINK